MRTLVFLAVLPGCSLLFDPDDHLGGDAGTRSDATPIDATGTDARAIDAPGTDAPADAGSSCPVTHSDLYPVVASPGPPSVTIDDFNAYVGFVAADAVRVNHYSLPGPELVIEFALTDTIVSAGVRAVATPTSVAIRRIESQLAFVVTGSSDSSLGASGVWVGYGENVTNLGTSATSSTQLGPVGISGGPTPRYFWNESEPDRLIGSLPVTAHGAASFRRLTAQVPPSPSHLDVSSGSMIVAIGADSDAVLVWNGDGMDNATSGTPESLTLLNDLAGPAIAALDDNRYAIVGGTSDELVVQLVTCPTPVGVETRCDTVGEPVMFAIPAPPRAIAASGIGTGVVIAAAHTNDAVTLTVVDSAWMSQQIPITNAAVATDSLDVDTALVGGRWQVAVAQLDRTNLLLTHLCL